MVQRQSVSSRICGFIGETRIYLRGEERAVLSNILYISSLAHLLCRIRQCSRTRVITKHLRFSTHIDLCTCIIAKKVKLSSLGLYSVFTMAKQTALHVTIQVAPHDVPAFLEALRPCWAGCASEEENLFFDVFEDPETPGLFRFVELWSKDKEWFFDVQFKKPYYKPYLEKTVPMWIADREQPFASMKESVLTGERENGLSGPTAWLECLL